jgi:hypothetical protein
MYGNFGVSQKIGLGTVLLATLLCATAALGQVQVGDNLFMNLDGNLGYAYSGSFGNYQSSTRAQGLAANAVLRGYYFHPNFLSFDVRPYYDRASSSSESQSITRSDGISASTNLFSGSNFPISAAYGLDFSNNNEFFIAGVPSVLGNSSGRHYSLGWSELLPNFPHVYVNFNASTSSSTLLSTSDESKTSSKNLNVNSDYKLAGWDLRGNLVHNNNRFTSPAFLTGESISFGGSGTSYGATAQHRIPLGAMSLGWSHSSYDSDQGGGGSGNNYNEASGITILRKLSISETFNYSTNTTAALGQSILNGNTPIRLPDRNSDGLFFLSTATLPVFRGLTVTGNFSHRQISFANQEFSDSQYGGSVNFTHQNRLLGFLNFSVGVVDTANKFGNSGLGLVSNVGMSKKIKHWDTAADFNYFQSVQTLYAVSTLSSYGYGGNIRRKINDRTHWAASYRGTHSGLTTQEGNYNKSDSFSTSLSWKRYSVSGNYSRSDGLAVLSSTGEIVPTPIGPLFSDYFYVFNARNWGINASTRVFQRLSVSGGYTNVNSDSKLGPVATLANGHRYFARTEYRLRRFSIQGGFSRVEQGVSTIPGGPRTTNSYYISFSRWFNVF